MVEAGKQGRPSEQDAFKKEVARVTRSRFATFKYGEFVVKTEDGEKVLHTRVTRGGQSRSIESVSVTIRDREPQAVEDTTEVYPYRRVALYTQGDYDSNETPENPTLIMKVGVAFKDSGSFGPSSIKYPVTRIPNYTGTELQKAAAGVSTPTDADLRQTRDLLSRVDRKNDRLHPVTGETKRERKQRLQKKS